MIRKKCFFVFLGMAAAFLLAFLLVPHGARAQNLSQPFTAGGKFAPAQASPHPKMSYALRCLVEIYNYQGPEALNEYARFKKLYLRENRVRVIIESWRSRLERMVYSRDRNVESMIQGMGGKIELAHDQYIQCWVPVYSLPHIADSPDIQYVRLPLRPVLLDDTEGLVRTGADAWKNIGPFHQGSRKVKVCILDAGFTGYTFLLGSELPSNLTVRSFRTDGEVETTEHGAACAEIVYDFCPDAEFYLVVLGETDLEHHLAVDWIISQKIDVVSYSIGWFSAGDGRGTGPICEDVKRASQAGVIWVASAGNEADSHWEGTFNDPDNDGWHNFPGGEKYFEFTTLPLMSEEVFLNWDDWGEWNGFSYPGATQDYDLYLYYWNGSAWVQQPGYEAEMTSANIQSGLPGQWPVEEVLGWYNTVYTVRWAVAIKKKNASRNCRLELFVLNHVDDLKYVAAEGSLTVPADAPGAVAVGASSWMNDTIHYYSSRGPTHDGRIKPELCAPSGVSTRSYGYQNFYGTSASAPHVAGAFTLLLNKTGFSKEQIKQIIFKRALDLGVSGPDNTFGYYGRLNLLK